MKAAIKTTFLSLLVLGLDAKKGCGRPGRPEHGRVVLKRDGFLLSDDDTGRGHLTGDQLVYSCEAGRTLLGSSTRRCRSDGAWSPSLPSCELNVTPSLGKSSVQSHTSGNRSSDLAVDGNSGTCAVIKKTRQQRWWQLKMEQKINLKAVKITLMKEPLIAVTIFTIEMLPGNRTLYKMCGRYNYTNSESGGRGQAREPRRFVTDAENQAPASSLRHPDKPEQITLEVACENQDAAGHFIFIRDDRKKEDVFKVCEVEVFSHSQDDKCGDPELPFGSEILNDDEDVKTISCKDGLKMIDANNDDIGTTNVITCSHGTWNSSHIKCESKRCPALAPVSHGRILLEFDDLEVSYRARLECDRGWVVWGHSSLACLASGLWSSQPGLSSCRPLSCGAPPPLDNAGVLLRNGSTLWRDEAVYTCDPGYLLVVNDSTAQQYAISVCSEEGVWLQNTVKCVDASLLGGYLSGTARISINIIYCLLALLIIMSVPLLAYYCCGRNCYLKRRRKKKAAPMMITGTKDNGEEDAGHDSGVSSGGSSLPSPKVGIYSVSSGKILAPATVSPNTLRSLSTSSNTFKPFSYTSQPNSLPYSNWPKKERNATRTSLQFHFDSPMMMEDVHCSTPRSEPLIDEAGYASLIIKTEDPVYEPVRESQEDVTMTPGGNMDNMYDDVPSARSSSSVNEGEHNYANLSYEEPGETSVTGGPSPSASYPDLVQMVQTKQTGTQSEPELRRVSDVSLDNLYAKVDLTRKRSRPNSSVSDETVVQNTRNGLDSYTKQLIEKFNKFL